MAGYVNPGQKVMKKPVFLRKQAFRKANLVEISGIEPLTS